MPMYDYLCEANGEVVEVVHGISKKFETWGELCDYAKHPPGDTPTDAPVTRLVGAGSVTNAPATTTKQLTNFGEASKNVYKGPAMAAPMRTGKH